MVTVVESFEVVIMQGEAKLLGFGVVDADVFLEPNRCDRGPARRRQQFGTGRVESSRVESFLD